MTVHQALYRNVTEERSLLQDQTLWSCLAGLAMANRELSTAEVAYAAIGEVNLPRGYLTSQTPLRLFNARLCLW